MGTMKITYAICVCTEHRELDSLLTCLKHLKDDEDDINVLVDSGKVTEKVKKVIEEHGVTTCERLFNGNFSEQRNYHIDQCSGDYIFVLDADEIPQEMLIKNIKHVITETSADIIYIPRMNIIPGYTQEWLKKYNFHINDSGFINWPDMQSRVFKNNGTIKWEKGLHEKLEGGEKCIGLQADVQLGIWHVKTIKKQELQDTFYKALSIS